jgi:beta-lactam-binding protein with PASTA domain
MFKNIMEKIIQYKAIAPTNGDVSVDTTLEATQTQLGDYKGKSLKETIAELVNMGLDFEMLSAGGDTVTAQHPEAGTSMDKGGKVLLNTENKSGGELTAVPDVTGSSVEDAQTMLEAVGFGCSVYSDGTTESETDAQTSEASESNTEVTSEQQQEAEQSKLTVSEQSPAAGKKIEQGTIVQIKVK